MWHECEQPLDRVALQVGQLPPELPARQKSASRCRVSAPPRARPSATITALIAPAEAPAMPSIVDPAIGQNLVERAPGGCAVSASPCSARFTRLRARFGRSSPTTGRLRCALVAAIFAAGRIGSIRGSTFRCAHDPAKWFGFADKIMRRLKLARDRTQNRYPLLLIARSNRLGVWDIFAAMPYSKFGTAANAKRYAKRGKNGHRTENDGQNPRHCAASQRARHLQHPITTTTAAAATPWRSPGSCVCNTGSA